MLLFNASGLQVLPSNPGATCSRWILQKGSEKGLQCNSNRHLKKQCWSFPERSCNFATELLIPFNVLNYSQMRILKENSRSIFVTFQRNCLRRVQLEKENLMGSISIVEPLVNIKSFIFFR